MGKTFAGVGVGIKKAGPVILTPRQENYRFDACLAYQVGSGMA